MAGATPFPTGLLSAAARQGTHLPDLKVVHLRWRIGTAVAGSAVPLDYFDKAIVTRFYGSTSAGHHGGSADRATPTMPPTPTTGRASPTSGLIGRDPGPRSTDAGRLFALEDDSVPLPTATSARAIWAHGWTSTIWW